MMEISKDNTQSLTNDSTTTTKIPGLSFPSGSKLKVGYLNEKKEGEGIVTSPTNIKLATRHFRCLQRGSCRCFRYPIPLYVRP